MWLYKKGNVREVGGRANEFFVLFVDLQLGVRVLFEGSLESALFVVDTRVRLVELATARAHDVHVDAPRCEDAYQHGRHRVLMQLLTHPVCIYAQRDGGGARERCRERMHVHEV